MAGRGGARFDVVCIGEALWDLTAPRGVTFAAADSLRMRAGGGAVNAAIALVKMGLGLKVGLAAALGDDAMGRALAARVAAEGVEVAGGVEFGVVRTGLVFVEASADGGKKVVAYRAEEEPAVAVPSGWGMEVLLVSGLSPAVEHAAAMCKAARAARRAGAFVVVDVNARRRLWGGVDPRGVRATVKEAHVVRCGMEDLRVLGIGVGDVRSMMGKGATLVVTDGAGVARASGGFGEVVKGTAGVLLGDAMGAGDAFTAAVCAGLARAEGRGVGRGAESEGFWDGALERGHAAARGWMRGRGRQR